MPGVHGAILPNTDTPALLQACSDRADALQQEQPRRGCKQSVIA
jgi:hypothetical protein